MDKVSEEVSWALDRLSPQQLPAQGALDDYEGQSMGRILKNLRAALLVELEQIKPEPDVHTIAKVHNVQEKLVSRI
jgi:hypothetical protein